MATSQRRLGAVEETLDRVALSTFEDEQKDALLPTRLAATFPQDATP
jgi:hypothetical protein